MDPEVDEYLAELSKWQDELNELRRISLECGLREEFKWKQPCYSYNKKNIFLLSGFKNFCSISFFKGALLNDKEGILYKHGENSQSSRSIRFTNIEQIFKSEQLIKANIFEAIEIEKAGLNVEYKRIEEYEIPEELRQKFEENTKLESAFKSLTPGRQKGYIIYFSQAKQSKTRVSRIEKYMLRILSGKGLNDCLCGHSKRMPICDGSHKYL